MNVDKFICNKFGLAEFFAEKYESLDLGYIRTALDVGAGAGPISLFLSHQKDVNTTAIEISPIAYECCLSNIRKYCIENKIQPINADFSAYRQYDEQKEFDLIVSNPPLRNKDSNCFYQLSINDIKEKIDSSIYSFLTNSWCDENQLDLLDHILLYCQENGHKQTSIAIVCCDIEYNSVEIVLGKAEKYNFEIKSIISGDIESKSIGAEGLIAEKIPSHIIVMRML